MDYTVSTSPEREVALQEEAGRIGLSALGTLQFVVDNFLDGRAIAQGRDRAEKLSDSWDKLTPEDKQAIDDVLAKVSPAVDVVEPG